MIYYITGKRCNLKNRFGSEAECWAHNPKVGGSKPPSDK